MSDFRPVSRAIPYDPMPALIRDLISEVQRNTAETERTNELLSALLEK